MEPGKEKVSIGPRDGGIVVAVATLWMLIAVSPQLRLTVA
jgi:hypothetical protein